MKIFVSSRMDELAMERKTAIESIHIAGHNPLYIETEPYSKDKQAKLVMDSLIKRAEALVLIYYLSEGKQEDILGNLTPIYYEFRNFKKLHPEKPIFLFKKKPPKGVRPSDTLLDWFDDMANKNNLSIKDFKKPEELAAGIAQELEKYEPEHEVFSTVDRIIIRYSGPDFIGLINKFSEVIFTNFKMNIDYISHASRGGLATIYLSCSPTEKLLSIKCMKGILSKNLVDIINKVGGEGYAIEGFDPKIKFEIKIDRDITESPNMQFYVELRTVDVPGQLNAICKVLKKLKFNIDELQQRPTNPEYKRQSNLILWLSLRNNQSKGSINTSLILLESAIKDLIGVRSFSIRIIT